MDIKVLDQKVKDLQSHLPFLEDFIKMTKANSTHQPQFLAKLETLYNIAGNKTKLSQSLAIAVKVEKAILEIRKRWETKSNDPTVKNELCDVSDKASVTESVSETPDSPPPTKNYDRTSPIEIPTERSDENKIKNEKSDNNRYDDNRRYRHNDYQRSERTDSRYDSGDRHRLRYDPHEPSKSHDRFKHDHRDRSNSSERSRHNQSDRNRHDNIDKHRSRYDRGREKYDNFADRDSFSGSRKKNDDRGDRATSSCSKTEKKYDRSDKKSPVGYRESKKIVLNPACDSVFNRLGNKVQSTADDDKYNEDEVAELISSHKKAFGCDSDSEINAEIKSLTEIRSKLALQIKLAEMEKSKDNKLSSTVTSDELPVSDMNKISLNNSNKKSETKFELNSLRECDLTSNDVAKYESLQFSFLQTFRQSSKTTATFFKPKNSESIDVDIVNKIVAQPIEIKNEISLIEKVVPSNFADPSLMDIVKQALATIKNNEENQRSSETERRPSINTVASTKRIESERLALKYNPKFKPRPDQTPMEAVSPQQNQADAAPNNQLAHINDPRLSRLRDPRVQAQQDSIRMQAFSPPSTPPCISNYPPTFNSNSYQKQVLLPTTNRFSTHPSHQHQGLQRPGHQHTGHQHPGHQHPGHQNHGQQYQGQVYPSNMTPPPYTIQPSNPNLKTIVPLASNYNIQRTLNIHHQVSPSSTESSPSARYQHQSCYSDHRNPQTIQNKFRPSLYDCVERQKYEQSRQTNIRRNSVYYEKSEVPMTYGEYKRSRQPTVSSTSEKGSNETITKLSSNQISKSHLDNVYRSGNYSTSIPLVATKSSVVKFRIPKKTIETAKSSDNIEENWDLKTDLEDGHSNVRDIRDSDDSECEIIGNVKSMLNSDSETSESRDPRIRIKALKNVSRADEQKSKESIEKEHNVVTSSTSVVLENQSPTAVENMETIFKQLMNPNSLLAMINLFGKEDDTLNKVKELLEQRTKDAIVNVSNDATAEKLNTSTESEKNEIPKTPRKKHKNELEKLNEDIRTMFISNGVLTATGRRVCAVYNANKEPVAGKNKTKKQAKDDDAIEKQKHETTAAPGARIMRRRNTVVCYTEPSSRSFKLMSARESEPPSATKERDTEETVLTTVSKPLNTTSEPKGAKTTPEPKTVKTLVETKTTKTTQESKSIKPTTEPNIVKKPTKGAKAKQVVEQAKDVDASPVTRITRSRLTKTCNIVLEKLESNASIESLVNKETPKKEVKRKRQLSEPNAKDKSETKKKRNVTPKMIVKNNNIEWHCLNKTMECQICEKPAGISLVSHYVNMHPKSEVFPSRLAPYAAERLRNTREAHKCERVSLPRKTNQEFRQLCYFCDDVKSFTRAWWINHISVHTGYYQYRCRDCLRKFSIANGNHACKGTNNVKKVPILLFRGSNIMAYLCDLCNFIRLDKNEMENHLRCEHEDHEGDVTKNFIEFVLLMFPKKMKKGQILEEHEHIELEFEDNSDSDANDSDSGGNLLKRRKLAPTEAMPEESSNKFSQSRVVHSEAFIAQPKEDDGLFDKDTMKLMKDMSFSASKDSECTSKTNRKSIAEKLSERFNLVIESNQKTLENSGITKAEPLDPLTCDEGITIIHVKANDNCAIEQSPEKPSQVTVIEKSSPSSPTTRENNCSPTQEFIDESDDNWESYSSEDTEDDIEPVDDTASSTHITSIAHKPNNGKNVGIIDTIARLQQSISSQGTSAQMEGVEKLADVVHQSDETVKDEEKCESTTFEREGDFDTSVTESVEGIAGETTSETENQPNTIRTTLTYENIVTEATKTEVEEDSDIKTCVSNDSRSNGKISITSNSNKTGSDLGSRNGNLGGQPSNSDPTSNDVEMEDLSNPKKILTRIDNIGYVRSTGTMGSSFTFCCLIDQCGFESNDLSDLLTHIDDHPVEWFGYCYTCNEQIHSNQVALMMEFKHMTEAHYSKKSEIENEDKRDQSLKPAFIKCKLLPGDKLSKLREAEIAAEAKQRNLQPTEVPVPSSSTRKEPSFLKISNVTSLTTPNVKLDSPSLVIANVISLGNERKYDDNRVVSLKVWGKNLILKPQNICRKMLRDISLYALYKCMEINCSFTTDNGDNMLTHLRNHENSSSSVADIPSWLECSYCDTIADSCSLLVKHIQDEHQPSIFQCPYCFYRSCAAHNVVVHLKQFHQSESKSVLVCNGKTKLFATEKSLIDKYRRENIRPLRCTEDCNKITYVMDYFVKHMKDSPFHTDKFKCQFCGFNILVSEAAKHFQCHSIGVFECVYCHFGTNDVQSIQNHMCNTHPSKLLYICLRLTRKDQELSNELLSSVESTMIVHLGEPVDRKLFQLCPFSEQQLSYMCPTIEANSSVVETAVIAVTVPASRTPQIGTSSCMPSGLEITSVTSISNETFSNVETVISSNSGLVLNDVLSYKDLEKSYLAEDYDKYFAAMTISQSKAMMAKKRTSSIQAKPETDKGQKVLTSTSTSTSSSRTDLVQEEIDIAAYNLVKGTGLEGPDLYRCSFSGCDEKSSDIFVFNVHLLKHNTASIGFKCYHCSLSSKNIVGLKYHIKVHGIHRYFCYFCNYTSAIVNDTHKHMQDTHSRTHVNSIPLNPKKVDQNKDMFVVCPRGLRQDELNRFGITLIDRNKRQLTSTKKFYSPEDLESLPRQAIFNSCISCAVCDYSTKVRTNMYRHLLAHKDEKAVPKVDPVNPVPCLDTGEKHFDKMINLACSSNDGKTFSTEYDPIAFVPESRRFVCNARNCQYQNISESMLKRHLNTLHENEESYKCPHCNYLISQKMDADKVVYHLRLHDAKIFKCPKCVFYHHLKTIVDRHKDDTHAGCTEQSILITRCESIPSTQTGLNDGQPKVSKWKCTLCNDLCSTQKQIQAHVQTAHCIKFQYQCDICNEVQSNNKATIQEHMNQKHPNVESQVKVYYTKVECTENDNTPIWRRDDPNKIKHIRGILFEEENVRKTHTTKKEQTEVKKSTSQKKRSDKPVVEQNSDTNNAQVVNNESEESPDDHESNPIVIISDEDVEADKSSNTNGKKPITLNSTASTSKNLLESGKSFMGKALTKASNANSVIRAEATSSGIKTKKDSPLDKEYVCGRCFNFSDNTIALVRAHQATAHPNTVCDVFKRNTITNARKNKNTTKRLPDVIAINSKLKSKLADNDIVAISTKRKPKFTDIINYVCFHCIFKSQNPNLLYKHWKENHKFPKVTPKNIEFPSRPFMFRISKIFQCYYCRRSGTYSDLKLHSQRNHPNVTFAMVDNINPKKCGVCLHQFENVDAEIIQHFNEAHKTTTNSSNEPSNYLTDELLNEIVLILPREQVKCTHCNILFFSMTELEFHNNEKHSSLESSYQSVPSDPIMYGCSKCQNINSSELAMIEHIREHFIQFQCNFCEKRFDHFEMNKVHQDIMHKSKDETYRNIDVMENIDHYVTMRIIFPNGLVLTKGELKHTRYGSMDTVIRLVTEINERDLEVVRKQQEEKRKQALEDNLTPIPKKSDKRLRIASDSEDSNIGNIIKLPTKSRSKRKKRRKFNPNLNPEKVPVTVPRKLPGFIATAAKKDVSNVSSEDEPLQRLIPFTFYGQVPKPVNLSTIFIHMPFGNSNVRVSCDRFSRLFNINPKLRLTRYKVD